MPVPSRLAPLAEECVTLCPVPSPSNLASPSPIAQPSSGIRSQALRRSAERAFSELGLHGSATFSGQLAMRGGELGAATLERFILHEVSGAGPDPGFEEEHLPGLRPADEMDLYQALSAGDITEVRRHPAVTIMGPCCAGCC